MDKYKMRAIAQIIGHVFFGILGLGLVALVLFCIGHAIFSSEPAPTPEEIAAKQLKSDSIDARTWAKIYIKNSLKAPKTAEFQNVLDFGVSQAKDEKGEPIKDVWEVSGYVDAENSFGAMLRNNWYIKLVKIGDKWTPTKIIMQ